jgi:hypothetical protein
MRTMMMMMMMISMRMMMMMMVMVMMIMNDNDHGDDDDDDDDDGCDVLRRQQWKNQGRIIFTLERPRKGKPREEQQVREASRSLQMSGKQSRQERQCKM